MQTSYRPLPSAAEARKRVIGAKAQLWKDPYSIRDAKAGETYSCTDTVIRPGGIIGEDPASCMCIELNAKNSYGGYTGIRRTIAVFQDSGGISSKDGGIKGFEQYCTGLMPFPELNGQSDSPKPR